MHITQTESSARIVKEGKVTYTNIASTLPSNFPASLSYEKITFLIRDDPRVAKLIDQVKDEIKKHDWHLPKDEEAVCKKTIELLHTREFFGPYNKSIMTDRKMDLLVQKRGTISEFKTGELVCKQEAAVASVVLHSIGVPNTYCAGVNWDGIKDFYGHAFLQTDTGNIVETTNPKFVFGKTLNHQMVKDGNVAVVEFSSRIWRSYGGGNMSTIDAVRYPFVDNKMHMLDATIKQNTINELIDIARKHGVALKFENERLIEDKAKAAVHPFHLQQKTSGDRPKQH